ncbi:hypothetical protein MMC08_007947 [Hypocenomyce scalaris]|nr:hypothetical protein [Hypocenomyce scalaris]
MSSNKPSTPSLPNVVLPFRDFDQESVFTAFESHFLDLGIRNFVIEFDNTAAHAAVDLDEEQIRELLKAEPERPGALGTKWINIWAPERQKPLVKAIAAQYEFTPRLLGLMCADPLKPALVVVPDTPRSRVHDFLHHQKEMERTSMQSQGSDPESPVHMTSIPTVKDGGLDLSHYKIINEVWHYSSVDWGHRYLCVGYNSLFNTHTGEATQAEDAERNHPQGKRLWTWLLLCDDGTVISIHENPFPDHQGPLDPSHVEELKIIRRNTLNVFRQLSKANEVQSPIMTLPLRAGLKYTATMQDNSHENPASLLFYYIFDDWYTSYSLVARREHRYGQQLEDLRKSMFHKAELDSIDRLHHIGRQLSTLKRIYQSYTVIIESILIAQKPVQLTAEVGVSASQEVGALNTEQQDTKMVQSVATTSDVSLGVALASSAIVRFGRLKDRINLYALSEIQECLDEKESLVFLNFNLVALKESQAVERLTRITILLAKVTILFLPVSLMTSYFSVSISDLQGIYTAKTYWTAFAIIMALSFIFLAVFGKLSGTVEGRPIYRSLSQTGFDNLSGLFKRARQKKRRSWG